MNAPGALVESLRLGRPIDCPEAVWLRYAGVRPTASLAHWTCRMPVGWIRAGQSLRLIFDEPALIHWGVDAWQNVTDVITTAGMLGLHIAGLTAESIGGARRIVFSVFAPGPQQWIERDRQVLTEPEATPEPAQAHYAAAA